MTTTVINGKRYTVERVFNMVANYHFTDKHGAIHLVDGEDVTEWYDEHGTHHDATGVARAIAYAKYYANESEDGVFWWKVK